MFVIFCCWLLMVALFVVVIARVVKGHKKNAPAKLKLRIRKYLMIKW